jgi:hypothetical protein
VIEKREMLYGINDICPTTGVSDFRCTDPSSKQL